MNNYRKRSVVPFIIIGLVFPMFVILSGVFLNVNTIDISSSVRPILKEEGTSVYEIMLEEYAGEDRKELMFSTTGNIITVTSGENILYSYGEEYAEKNQMIGDVYVHTFLPNEAYKTPIRIKLEAWDSDADPDLYSVELCPHEESLRYYITNETFGLPIALELLATAFCIPIFLFLIDELTLMFEGMTFGAVLICLSVMLLSRGGHFLLFYSNQHIWSNISYVAQYLFPCFFILYFALIERSHKRYMLLVISLIGFLVSTSIAVISIAGVAKFCDFSGVFYAMIGLDVVACAFPFYSAVREKRLTRTRMLILNLAAIWAVIVLLFIPFSVSLKQFASVPHLDMLSIFSVLIFYLMCGLYAESAHNFKYSFEEKDLRIEQLEENEKEVLSAHALAQALSAHYESIYLINIETSAYTCYHESEAHGELGVDSEGDDFFVSMIDRCPDIIVSEDIDYFRTMIKRETVLKNTENGAPYSFVYRVIINDKEPVYHKIKATRQMIDNKEHILLGIRDIDEMMKREKEHENRQQSMLQKEKNHMKAILSSAIGYMEVNLTKDLILEHTNSFHQYYLYPYDGEELSYSSFLKWWSENAIIENKEKYLRVNNRELLIENYKKGILRATVSFSSITNTNVIQPCRQVAFLYRDTASDDIMCFNVTYDLTDQQRAEKEMRELRSKLQMSRLRVFTGQMQPHFLYNALGSIQEVVLENPGYASELIGDFSKHLRATIRAMSSDDPIPFSQELENIKAYISIEKMRFGDRLHIEYDIRATDFVIAPLSIQPIVENSIRHGVYERGKRGGTVRISSCDTEAAWIIRVEDDGVGFDCDSFLNNRNDNNSASAGLNNLIFRLNKMMNAEVDIKSVINEGTLVTVTIPKRRLSDESNNS